MRLGLIGRGPWGDVYAKTLKSMGIDFVQAGKDWRDQPVMDAVIVACAAQAHFKTAKQLISAGVPVLIEKPVCLSLKEASELLKLARFMGSIVFTGHTRLYSSAWRAFKTEAREVGVKSVYAVAGGPCKLVPLWDWGPHLVSMCMDLGFDTNRAHILTMRDAQPLKVIVNGNLTYTDAPETPAPLVTLLTEFITAVAARKEDLRGLEFGVRVVKALEKMDNVARYGT